MFSSVMVEWLIKAVRLAVLLVGAATILQVWGIAIGPILAGLGLIGVAVALGAQDLFKNLIAGILIIVERRFSHGDWVFVDGIVEGTIESIGFRSTLVRRFDKAPVFVPNAKLSDNAVTNFSMMTHRRIYWRIGVLYSTTIEQLREVREKIERYVLDTADFAGPDEVPTFVRIDSFNDSSIDIMLYCFTRTTTWGEWLEVKERLAYRVKDIVEAAGTGFAFPSRSLYIETPAGEIAEVFEPPAARTAERTDTAAADPRAEPVLLRPARGRKRRWPRDALSKRSGWQARVQVASASRGGIHEATARRWRCGDACIRGRVGRRRHMVRARAQSARLRRPAPAARASRRPST